MDWRIRDEEMMLKHPSLHLGRLRELLLLGKKVYFISGY